METVTQALVGAVIGLAGFQTRLGYKALAWGALAASIANIDSLAILFDGPLAEFSYRHAQTHSILWPFLLGPVFAWLTWNLYRRKPPSVRPIGGQNSAYPAWALLWVLCMLSHLAVDLVSGPGLMLLHPFSTHRFALYGLSLFDMPLIALLAAGLAVGMAARRRPAIGMSAAGIVLAAGSAYAIAAVDANRVARNRSAETLDPAQIAKGRLYVGPTLYQPFLRRVVLVHPEEIWIGQISLAADDPGTWSILAAENGSAVAAFEATREGRAFLDYADGIVVAQETGAAPPKIVFIDLRFADPGAVPHDGRWKIAATIGADGAIRPPVSRLKGENSLAPDQLAEYWRAIKGGANGPGQ